MTVYFSFILLPHLSSFNYLTSFRIYSCHIQISTPFFAIWSIYFNFSSNFYIRIIFVFFFKLTHYLFDFRLMFFAAVLSVRIRRVLLTFTVLTV